MQGLRQIETVIVLLVVVLALVTISRRVLVPYPIFSWSAGSSSVSRPASVWYASIPISCS
jgi:hypothetical protein